MLIEGVKFAGQVIPALFKKPEPKPVQEPQVLVQPNIEVNVNTGAASKSRRRKETLAKDTEGPSDQDVLQPSETAAHDESTSQVALPPTIVEERNTYINDNRTLVADRRTYIQNNLTVHQVDKRFFNEVIDRANQNLSNVIANGIETIITEIRREQARNAVREVQAHVTTLHSLAGFNDLDPQLAVQLMTNILNPLQIRIEYARLTLTEAEDQNLWNLCYLSGTTALITGYAFLGQDVPHLREALESRMQEIQITLIDEVARKQLSGHKSFPWEKVPRLLLPEGADDLAELYMATLKPNEGKSRSLVLAKPTGPRKKQSPATGKRRN